MHPARLLRRAAAGSGARAALAFAAVLALASLGSCAGRRAGPPPISAGVRAEVELAERAELARDHAAARRHYDAAIARAVAAGEPGSIRFARRELAETLISWGELADAEAQLDHLVALVPDDAAGWHDLGMVRHGLGDPAGAVAALARARQLAPDDPRPRIALAALYWKRGDKQAARLEYQALLSLELPDRVRDKVRWALEQLAR